MITRRSRRLALGDEFDVVQVDYIEVRRMQTRETARNAGADAMRSIVKRVPRISKPAAFCELQACV